MNTNLNPSMQSIHSFLIETESILSYIMNEVESKYHNKPLADELEKVVEEAGNTERNFSAIDEGDISKLPQKEKEDLKKDMEYLEFEIKKYGGVQHKVGYYQDEDLNDHIYSALSYINTVKSFIEK